MKNKYCPTRLSIEPNQIARSNIVSNKVYASVISKCKKPNMVTTYWALNGTTMLVHCIKAFIVS